MAIKTHEKYGEVEILERSAVLVRIATSDGDEFWVTAASFAKAIPKVRAKKPKHLRKKNQIVHKVESETPDLVTDLAAGTTGRIELPDGVEEPGDESVEELLNQYAVLADETNELEVQKDDTETELEGHEVWQADGAEETSD